jgi:hypothetical protein
VEPGSGFRERLVGVVSRASRFNAPTRPKSSGHGAVHFAVHHPTVSGPFLRNELDVRERRGLKITAVCNDQKRPVTGGSYLAKGCAYAALLAETERRVATEAAEGFAR